MTNPDQPDRAHFRITLDIVLDANGEDPDYLAQRMNSAVYGAIMSGSLLTLDSDAKVLDHTFRTNPLSDQEAGLTEAQVAQWLSQRMASGALAMKDIPALMASYALSDPGDMRQSLAEEMAEVPAPQTANFFYALAETLEDGLLGRFIQGPFQQFDPRWLSGDEMVMRTSDIGDPEIPYEEMMPYAGSLSADLRAMLHQHLPNLSGSPELGLLGALLNASGAGQTQTQTLSRTQYPQRMR